MPQGLGSRGGWGVGAVARGRGGGKGPCALGSPGGALGRAAVTPPWMRRFSLGAPFGLSGGADPLAPPLHHRVPTTVRRPSFPRPPLGTFPSSGPGTNL